jgi:hypothetical protein
MSSEISGNNDDSRRSLNYQVINRSEAITYQSVVHLNGDLNR